MRPLTHIEERNLTYATKLANQQSGTELPDEPDYLHEGAIDIIKRVLQIEDADIIDENELEEVGIDYQSTIVFAYAGHAIEMVRQHGQVTSRVDSRDKWDYMDDARRDYGDELFEADEIYRLSWAGQRLA